MPVSSSEQIVAIDTASLEWQVDSILPFPNTVFDQPEEAIAHSHGSARVSAAPGQVPASLLALWDPFCKLAE
jgi:hypothetical protein